MTAQQKKSTDLATVDSTVREWAPALKDFALTEFDHNHFFRSAILAISESKTLMECMATATGRESVKNAMKRAFSTGLSLNPQEGKAAIIAYNGKASYQIMKEGAIDIVMGTGDVKSIMVEIVYENDTFSVEKSNAGDIYHYSPARRDRGQVDGYFCAITGKDDISHVKYMTQEECFEIRDRYSTGYMYAKDKNTSGWGKSPKGYSKKTVIKASIRDLHLSPSAKAQFSSEDVEFSQPPAKDITPKKQVITGQTADDVAGKLTDKKPEPGAGAKLEKPADPTPPGNDEEQVQEQPDAKPAEKKEPINNPEQRF